MPSFIVFSRQRRHALREADSTVAMPDIGPTEITVESPFGYTSGGDLDALALVDTPGDYWGFRAETNPVHALSVARLLALDAIRSTARELQDQLDIRHNARLGELRINRTDPARIEAYYTALLEQQQVRDSSNAAQADALAAATPSAAWAIVDALDLYSAPVSQLGQNITKYAFIARLNLTPAEKQNPYIAGLQADLLALAMVNLPLVSVELQKLVTAGVLTQSRVDAVVNAPIAWTERETNF